MSRAWRDVDLDALAHNARVLQGALAPGCRLMAVVKADAYGHGAFPVAHRLEQEGVEAFAVACLAEGMDLRRMGVRGKILILGYTPPEEAPLLCRWRLTQTVVDEHHGQALAARGLPLAVHLALDTGMHRLGVPAEDHGALERLYALPHLKIEGVFSHLCVSDSLEAEDVAFTHLQLERFYGAVRWLRDHGYDPGETHIQASYGIWNLPPQPCAWARAGIALYGVASGGGPTARALDLRPALSLRAWVASVRTLSPRRGGGLRPGLPGGGAGPAGGGDHRLCRRPAPGSARPGRGGPPPGAALPHGGAAVHGPAAAGCDGGAGGGSRRRGHPHRSRRRGDHPGGGAGGAVRHHHQRAPDPPGSPIAHRDCMRVGEKDLWCGLPEKKVGVLLTGGV